MATIQCPKCPLRFDLRPMLADHLATDHGFTAESVAHLQPESVRIGFQEPRGIPAAPPESPEE